MHESESNLDSLIQYENNIVSSNLQIDSDDISWNEEHNSLDQISDMIVDDEEEVKRWRRRRRWSVYKSRQKRGKKDNKKINKKSYVSKSNKPHTRLDSKKPWKKMKEGLVTLIGHLILWGASPIYPSSTSTLSPGPRKVNQRVPKIVISLYFPAGNWPFTQTISPVMTLSLISYLSADFLFLWEKNFLPYSKIQKSVPSTDIRQSFPISPLYLLLNII